MADASGLLSERVVGFHVSRVVEDHYKLKFDEAIRQMKPTIHPHQYRCIINVCFLLSFVTTAFVNYCGPILPKYVDFS